MTTPLTEIPLFDLRTPLEPLHEALVAAAERVIRSGVFILGEEVEAFEAEFAAYLGVEHVVGVANGTDALTIALRAIGVGPGDEVIVPAFTFYACAEAIPPTGARPVFCDVDPETMMATAETVRACLTPRTKAIVAVHLFGNVAPVAEIAALGVPVLEDAAQASGSRVKAARPGALGSAATFSFYPTKNLGCLGDGGAIATNDERVAELARTLRFHGSRDQRTWELIGYNSRLDALQAAFLRVLLPELDGWAAGRSAAGRAYEAAGLGELVSLPQPTAEALAAWHVYVIRSPQADLLRDGLNAAGIGAKVYYRPGLHRAPALAQWHDRGDLPVTEELSRTHLAIPIGPRFGGAEAATVTARVREVLADVAR